jgi:hypothetical protein
LSAPLLEFGSEIWVGEGPIIPFYFGFSYPARMVVVRLSDGDLFVWSPIPLSLPMRREVDKTGARPPRRCPQSVTSPFSRGMEIRLSRSSPIRRSWPAQATRRPHLRFRLGRFAEPTLGGGPRSGPHARQCRDDGSRIFPLSKSNGYFCRSDPKPAKRLVQGLAEDSRAHRRHRRPEPRRASGLASQLHQSSRGACVVGTYSPLADRTSADRSRGAGRRQWLGVRSRGLLVAAGTTRRRLGDQDGEVTPQRSLESPDEPLGRTGSSGPRPIRRLPHSGILSCFFHGFSSFLFRNMASARESRRRVACGRITSSI